MTRPASGLSHRHRHSLHPPDPQRQSEGFAQTILSANIMGGTCGRACPTEVLCEQAWRVERPRRGTGEIGLLQRHAWKSASRRAAIIPFVRAAPSGKRLAVVGAGPAGLSFAHRAAMLGHDVTVFEANRSGRVIRSWPPTRWPNDFAQKK